MKLRTRTLTAGVAVVALVAVAGCSEKYSAERDGKKLGEAICDLHDAESAEDAEAALADINEQLDDLGNKFAMYTAEDRADIANNPPYGNRYFTTTGYNEIADTNQIVVLYPQAEGVDDGDTRRLVGGRR